MTLTELYDVWEALKSEMEKLKEFSDFDNQRLLDVNKEYIKLTGQWTAIKSKIRYERLQVESKMEEIYSQAIHELMYESDVAYTYQEAKQFALANKTYRKYVERHTIIKACERLCDDAIGLLKSIGWSLKLRADLTLEGLDDIIV